MPAQYSFSIEQKRYPRFARSLKTEYPENHCGGEFREDTPAEGISVYVQAHRHKPKARATPLR